MSTHAVSPVLNFGHDATPDRRCAMNVRELRVPEDRAELRSRVLRGAGQCGCAPPALARSTNHETITANAVIVGLSSARRGRRVASCVMPGATWWAAATAARAPRCAGWVIERVRHGRQCGRRDERGDRQAKPSAGRRDGSEVDDRSVTANCYSNVRIDDGCVNSPFFLRLPVVLICSPAAWVGAWIGITHVRRGPWRSSRRTSRATSGC